MVRIMIDKLIDDCIMLDESIDDYDEYESILNDSKRELKQAYNDGKTNNKTEKTIAIAAILLLLIKYDDYKSIVGDSNSELYGIINRGRDSIASNFAQTAIFTSIVDERRCPDCGALHGERYKVGSGEYSNNMPPLHNRCRCIYEYILERNY